MPQQPDQNAATTRTTAGGTGNTLLRARAKRIDRRRRYSPSRPKSVLGYGGEYDLSEWLGCEVALGGWLRWGFPSRTLLYGLQLRLHDRRGESFPALEETRIQSYSVRFGVSAAGSPTRPRELALTLRPR
jgi:hypothetical protein